MIKINLLPVKKKKKAKPLPGFLFAGGGVAIAAIVVFSYLAIFYSSRISSRKARVEENKKTIEQLDKKIKSVQNYEKLNKTYKEHKEIIEQLGKNKTVPVKAINEISSLLPPGVWFNTLDIKGLDVNVNGTGFTNADVVNYVSNLKASPLLADVFLLESVQNQQSGFSVYVFKITYKLKV